MIFDGSLDPTLFLTFRLSRFIVRIDEKMVILIRDALLNRVFNDIKVYPGPVGIFRAFFMNLLGLLVILLKKLFNLFFSRLGIFLLALHILLII